MVLSGHVCGTMRTGAWRGVNTHAMHGRTVRVCMTIDPRDSTMPDGARRVFTDQGRPCLYKKLTDLCPPPLENCHYMSFQHRFLQDANPAHKITARLAFGLDAPRLPNNVTLRLRRDCSDLHVGITTTIPTPSGCLVGENPTCSVPASYECQGLWS